MKTKIKKDKPTHYHWHIYTAAGEWITTCELKGGRDRAKRSRAELDSRHRKLQRAGKPHRSWSDRG
jgi:hypothetical protein